MHLFSHRTEQKYYAEECHCEVPNPQGCNYADGEFFLEGDTPRHIEVGKDAWCRNFYKAADECEDKKERCLRCNKIAGPDGKEIFRLGLTGDKSHSHMSCIPRPDKKPPQVAACTVENKKRTEKRPLGDRKRADCASISDEQACGLLGKDAPKAHVYWRDKLLLTFDCKEVRDHRVGADKCYVAGAKVLKSFSDRRTCFDTNVELACERGEGSPKVYYFYAGELIRVLTCP